MKQTAPSARRFVTLRASGNNVMRKLEVHRPLAPALRRLRWSEPASRERAS
ncbi:MAG: hypothetical protein IKS67_11485 [Victivallales bacterium]|nr:hypothetical protein [Victivallales bacterium]